jgi:hypothetical protein
MSVDIELRKAAAYISAGKNDAAYTVLSEYLRDFPDSDLAWLLLSYTIEDPRKQLASVSRALRLNPDNSKAKDRLERLSEKISGQSSEEPASRSESIEDWPSFFPDSQPRLNEWPSQPLSIEDRLAFVTLEAEASSGYMPSSYPAESFYTHMPLDQDSGLNVRKPRRIRLKNLLIGGVLLIVFITAVIIAVKFINGDFISKADAQATASVETAVALATSEAKRQLPPTWTPTITPTFTITPTPSGTPTPTASPTPNEPDPTLVAEIEILQQQAADLRQLPILEEVNVNIIMRSRVRPLLNEYYNSFADSLDQIEDLGIVLEALGLIYPNYDLLTNVLNSLADGVGGFYLHETNQIYLIGNRFTAIEKYIYAHEYDHALIDQHFNLNALNLYPNCEGDEDRCKAIQALVEGDASLLMNQWLMQAATLEEYDVIMNYVPPNRILVEQNPPPFAIRNNEFPYLQGLTFVDTLYARGGWARIDQAYTNLPKSTEQILHPEKYLSGEAPLNVPSVSLQGVLGDHWRLVRNNTLGEWMTYLILGYSVDPRVQVGELNAVRASEGWGGDNYQVYRNEETGDTVLVVHWKWDRPVDVEEFKDAMHFYLERQFSTRPVERTIDDCWESDRQVSCLYSADRQNLWIVGPSMELVQSLKILYPAFR